MAKNDGKENKDDEQLLGSSNTPEAQKLPTTNGAENTVDVPTTEAGSATHLNAYRQDLEDGVAKAHNAIDEFAETARKALDKAQANQ